MEEVRNPFRPGAGNPPPDLAGREEVLAKATVALQRVLQGDHDRGQLMLGLRGVGKTVLLNRIEVMAKGLGYETIEIEATEEQRLAAMLALKLRSVLVRLSGVERAKDVARRGLGILRGFASAFKVTLGEIEFGIDPAPGTADSGHLETDLPELFITVGEAAQAAKTGVALFVDEVQYLAEAEFGALVAAMHRISQKGRPLILFGAGLPQIAGLAGDAKSYAERLFHFPPIGPLKPDAARAAVRIPVEARGAAITPEALDRVFEVTQGYPYFLQEWGYHAWNASERSPIRAEDIVRATAGALRALDQDFFKVRFDRLTPREKDYMRAMAALGPGPHRSKDIAKQLRIAITVASPLRTNLIRKGMIYSAEHGTTAFTVPMFDDFMRRTMPEATTDDDSEPTPVTTRGKATRPAARAHRRRGGKG